MDANEFSTWLHRHDYTTQKFSTTTGIKLATVQSWTRGDRRSAMLPAICRLVAQRDRCITPSAEESTPCIQ